jgi:hypothetical protein
MAKLSKAEVEERRETALRDIARIRGAPVEVVRQRVKFTCDDCPSTQDCVWSFDSYNIDGDCLFLK